METIIIPAGGKGTRWKRSTPKHLATIGQETVIERILRQLKAINHAYIPYVLTDDARVWDAVRGKAVPIDCDGRTLAHSLWQTNDLWKDDVVILLGDVVFSDEAIQTILYRHNPLMFYGTIHEIFALRWMTTSYEHLASQFHVVLQYADGHLDDEGAGKLWSLYKAHAGTPQEKEAPYLVRKFFGYITDWTKDIDALDDYNWIIHRMKEEGVLKGWQV